MEATHRQIVEYWARHQSESGLSVDWSEAERLCWRCAHSRCLHRCHIVPQSLGGPDDPSNLVLLCAQCHAEAPNVADATFMWTWLRAHAVACYGTYWQIRGFREYEFVFGRKPFEEVQDFVEVEAKLRVVLEKYMKQTSTHWGQGKLNPATVAWLLRRAEDELQDDAQPVARADPLPQAL
jgi:HNH endonuclease